MTREDQLIELARRADEQKLFAERERRFDEMQDSYYLHYVIGDTQFTILFAAFKLMTIPYSQILEIEVASIFDRRSAQVDLSNGIRQMCRIKKSRGWFRYVIVTPREPKLLLDAFHAFQSRANPIESDAIPSLPHFLSSHDNSH